MMKTVLAVLIPLWVLVYVVYSERGREGIERMG